MSPQRTDLGLASGSLSSYNLSGFGGSGLTLTAKLGKYFFFREMDGFESEGLGVCWSEAWGF